MTDRPTRYTVLIDNGYHVEEYTADGFRSLATTVETMIGALPDEAERVRARMLLKRWLAHPEGGRQGSALVKTPMPGPGRGGYANRQPTSCVRCGHPRTLHDLDGQRADCDGYIGEPR